MQRKTVYCTVCALLFAVSMAAGVFAQTVSFQYGLGGSARYGLIDRDDNATLYSLMGGRLFIADVSNISTPVEISSLALPGIARRIAQSGDILYISCTHGGLVAVDVADPAKPAILSVTTFDKTDAIGQTFGVAVKNQYVYVADYSGAFVLDMTDPSAPVKVGEFTAFDKEHHNAYDAYVDNNTLFISCEMDGLYIFDISVPTTLNKIGQYPGQYYCSLRDGNYLYIAAGGAGFDILDISDLANPKFVSNLENNYGGVLQFVKAGGYVYLSSEFEDFYKVDVSDPAHPVQIQKFLCGGNHSLGVSTTGNYVVLANSNYGIRIFDHRSAAIQQVGEFLSLGRVVDCKGAGDFAYAAVGLKGLAILDMTNPQQPLQVAQKTLTGYANGLAIAGLTAYVVETNHEGEDGGLLEIVNVTNPSAPVILGSVALPGQPYSVQVQGNLAVVACQTAGVAIVDVSDTSSPEVLGTYNTSGICYAPLVWGDYILAADGLKGFMALDIKAPGFPKKIADSYNLGYNFGNVVDIALWDTWMYLPASEALHIANFDPLYLPTSDNASYIDPITRRHLTGQLKAVAAFDGYLLVADSVGGVRLFDIAQQDSPQETDNESYIVSDPLRISYAADQGLAYVSSGIGGLYIFEVAVPKKPAAQANGIWFGTGTDISDNGTIGIVADLYQAHDKVTGTLTMYDDTVLKGAVTASTSDNASSVKGTILYDGGTTGTIELKKSGSSLTGTISAGSLEVADISLAHTTDRGLLSFENIAPSMNTGITSALVTAKGLKKRRLTQAQKILTAALEQPTLEGQLKYSALAVAMTSPRTATGALAASEALLYQSALWETHVAQAEAGIMASTLCADYKKRINLFLSLGDRALETGMQAGESGRLASALASFSTAALHYRQVAAYYQKNVANCPTWGVADFDGYYEGVIDFGFIAAVFKVCAAQSGGTVTGPVRIDIEASNEHMTGTITDGLNTTRVVSGNEESVVTGMILVQIGDITAHIKMVDWKYNISTDQWEGQAEVQEQKVTGNVTLKKAADTCPDGFPEG
jgi:hypothetical protein